MFWNRKRGSWRDDLANLKNCIHHTINQLKSDILSYPVNSVYYNHMLNACYEALADVSEGDISGVSKAETTLGYGRAGEFYHLDSDYHFSHNMVERYYDNYYADYRYS